MQPTGRRVLVAVLAAGLVSAGAAACKGTAEGASGGSPGPSATTSASGTPVGPSRTPVPPTSIRPTVPPVSPTVRPTVQPTVEPTVQPTVIHPTVQPPVPTEPGQPRKPPTGGVTVILTGMAVMGAEPGCVGLHADGRTYELTGDAPQQLAGNRGYGQELGRVRVSGHLAPKTMVSHCMMGPIFVVRDLTVLS